MSAPVRPQEARHGCGVSPERDRLAKTVREALAEYDRIRNALPPLYIWRGVTVLNTQQLNWLIEQYGVNYVEAGLNREALT